MKSLRSCSLSTRALSLCAGVFLSVGLFSAADCYGAEAKEKDKVLRHAVFFKFKDGASKEDVKSVVDAFRALPAKIEQITGFESGESVGKSGRNDGFTHCFLLTFDDEEGRAAYLPHPAHKEFGNVLRPHLDKVFVIDYWGRPEEKPLKEQLRHAVFLKFKDDTSKDAVRVVEEGLAGLPSKIDSIKGFEWGKNNSPEKHDQGFTHCFMFTFNSEEGLKAYIDHPDHVVVAKDLLPKMEKVRVMDFFAEQTPAASDDKKRGE